MEKKKRKISSPGGLEPPTFRLTAERANRLRHGDLLRGSEINVYIIHCGCLIAWGKNVTFLFLIRAVLLIFFPPFLKSKKNCKTADKPNFVNQNNNNNNNNNNKKSENPFIHHC